ncbi:hypothetical protein [Cyanobium sp. WAJ14-Wanaka]|uniref:hypothetical protein n=1 Tax=Cyanobium sp. WAJ14-Wanaka TaxID=2823725 RepID=UPI0020CBEA9D|nr:hypothetical protein [Cyanobium sp. WAJ14-Wanaka]MCP9775676.1 hypothetical protein [Cyanobium sp. WAJ14-Wanaka]
MELKTVGLIATELSFYCRERILFTEQLDRWRQASQNSNEKLVLILNAITPNPTPGEPAGEHPAAKGAAPKGHGAGGGGSTADCLKNDQTFLVEVVEV